MRGSRRRGLALIALAAVSWGTTGSVTAVLVERAGAALARTSPLALAGVNFSVAALVLAPVLAGPDVGRQITLGWPWLLYLGAVTTAGAYAIYTTGLRDVDASAAGIASLLEPLTA